MKLIGNLKDAGYTKEAEHVSQLRLRLLGVARDTPVPPLAVVSGSLPSPSVGSSLTMLCRNAKS